MSGSPEKIGTFLIPMRVLFGILFFIQTEEVTRGSGNNLIDTHERDSADCIHIPKINKRKIIFLSYHFEIQSTF